MTEFAEEENDLMPPPISLSLPELFSVEHQMVEIMREAVSSTELLHERAMERFYRAVAVEEASEIAKRKMLLERQTGELAQTSDVETAQRSSSLRRRLSNSGVTTQNLIVSWQAKKNRRRSSEGQTEVTGNKTMKLLSPTLLPDVEARSDPNLPSVETTATPSPWRRSSDEESMGRLRRWHEANVPLLEEEQTDKSIIHASNDEEMVAAVTANGTEAQTATQAETKEEQEMQNMEESIETSEESSEEISSADSEDLRLLRSRILARGIMDEEDTYHPRGRPVPHVEPEQIPYDGVPTLEILPPPSVRMVAPVSPSNVVPKSILKKPRDETILHDNLGRSIPPEKPIRKTLPQQYQQEETERISDVDAEERSPDHPSTPDALKTPAMSESDTDSILSAAEAAKSRRIQSKLRSLTSEEETAETEARMAVVNQYTEIVREYSRGGRDSAASSRRSSISEDDQKYRAQEKPAALSVKKPEHDDNASGPLGAKDKSDIGRQKRHNRPAVPRKESIDSRDATPARDATTARRHGSRPSSRDQSPAVRRRDLPAERMAGASSRSSSKTRNRTPSRDRGNRGLPRDDSNEVGVAREKSVERTARRSKIPSRPSSRSSSRSNSRERHGTTVPVESQVERLQKALGSNKYRATRRGSEVTRENEGYTPDRTNGEQLALEAKKTVRSTVNYVTDLTLLAAATYVYLFKRETLAVPFIALLLYRRTQEQLHGWLPRRWRRPTKKP